MAESSTRRARITREGTAYLTNYARTVNAYPARAEKLSILDDLHALPGNQHVTLGKLNNWFTRYRYTSHDLRPAPADDETILFPKLTPTHLQQLRVLYKRLHEPSDGVVSFWAKRIGADIDEVRAWVEYQQEKAKEPESPDVSPTLSDFPRPHLPTPAKSLSPQTRMPSLPPIAIKVEHQSPTEHKSVLEGLPPLSRSLRQKCRDTPPTLEQCIRDSLKSDLTRSEPLPQTVDEFSAQFEPVEHMINAFMKKYASGQLASLGWDSNLIKSTS